MMASNGVMLAGIVVLVAVISATAYYPHIDKEFVVAAYLPNWRYQTTDWDDLHSVASHVLLYSVEPKPSGEIDGLDRLPSEEQFTAARAARDKYENRLMLSVGGTDRSAGFRPMVRSKKALKVFITQLVDLLQKHDLDGIDFNWEYPGYSFEKGWDSYNDLEADFKGFGTLLRQTKRAIHKVKPSSHLTVSYYPEPESKMEEHLMQFSRANKHCDYLLAKGFEQKNEHDPQHANIKFTEDVIKRAVTIPSTMVCLGLPFFGKNIDGTGDQVPYSEIVNNHNPGHADDQAGNDYFNGPVSIARKLAMAAQAGLAGVMIWEVGQDCRADTCPRGKRDSLLEAVRGAMNAAGLNRMKRRLPEEEDIKAAYLEKASGKSGSKRLEL